MLVIFIFLLQNVLDILLLSFLMFWDHTCILDNASIWSDREVENKALECHEALWQVQNTNHIKFPIDSYISHISIISWLYYFSWDMIRTHLWTWVFWSYILTLSRTSQHNHIGIYWNYYEQYSSASLQILDFFSYQNLEFQPWFHSMITLGNLRTTKARV